MCIESRIKSIKNIIPDNVELIAVSKRSSLEDIMVAYRANHKVFAENRVQDLLTKYDSLPRDIQWHMIGSLQTNKVKYIAKFITLIHSLDSLKLMIEINKQAEKNNRTINCLIQIKIAKEDSKKGANEQIALEILNESKTAKNIKIKGLMGMSTFTTDKSLITEEFDYINKFYSSIKDRFNLSILSIGMTNDYQIAISKGSNMIRVGTAIFG